MGTYFVYENTLYASYSAWIITYSVEIEPYRDHLSNIHREIATFSGEIQDLVSEPTKNTTKLRETQYIRNQIIALIQEESRQFFDEYYSLVELLNSILTFTVDSKASILPVRKKRSVLPFVGDLLSALFGVATVENVGRIRDSLADKRCSL